MNEEPSTSYYEPSRTFTEHHERSERHDRDRRHGRSERSKSTGGWLSMFGKRKKSSNRSFFRLPTFSMFGRSRPTTSKASWAETKHFPRRPAGVRWRGGGRRPRDSIAVMQESRMSESGISTVAPDDYRFLSAPPVDFYQSAPMYFNAQLANAYNQPVGPQFTATAQPQYLVPVPAPNGREPPVATAYEDPMIASRFVELPYRALSSQLLPTLPPPGLPEVIKTPPRAPELATTDSTSALTKPLAAPAVTVRDTSDTPAPTTSTVTDVTVAKAPTVPGSSAALEASAPAPSEVPGTRALGASAAPAPTAPAPTAPAPTAPAPTAPAPAAPAPTAPASAASAPTLAIPAPAPAVQAPTDAIPTPTPAIPATVLAVPDPVPAAPAPVPATPAPVAPDSSRASIPSASASFWAKQDDIGRANRMVRSQMRSQADGWRNAAEYYFPETDADFGASEARWRGPPPEEFGYGAEPWVEVPEYRYPFGSYAHRRTRLDSSPWLRHRERRRRSVSGSRRRGRRHRRSRSKRSRYEEEDDEEQDSERDSELSSSSDDSEDYDERPRQSRDRKRGKHPVKGSKKKSRHYRRSICECDEYECWPRIFRRTKSNAPSPVEEPVEQPPKANDAQFPEFLEELTEDYLAPGHPNYDTASGGAIVRRTRSIRPLKDEDVIQPGAYQYCLMPRLTTSRQWKRLQQPMTAFPSYEGAGVCAQPAEAQWRIPDAGNTYAPPFQRYEYGYDGQATMEANRASAARSPYGPTLQRYGYEDDEQAAVEANRIPAARTPYAAPVQRYRYGYDGEAAVGANKLYAEPINISVPPEYLCGMCGCADCPDDCWANEGMPQSDLEERLRMDERQRLDFEERVRMQERMERLEERMWMYDRWGRRPKPRFCHFEEHEPAGEQFDEEGHDYADQDETWQGGSEAESLYSQRTATGRTKSSRGDTPGKVMRPSERYRLWKQTHCSLSDHAHRRSSTSSTSESTGITVPGKRLKKCKQRRRMSFSEESVDADEPFQEAELEGPAAAATSVKSFSWTSAALASSHKGRRHFAWSSLSGVPSVLRGGKRVSYVGQGPPESLEKRSDENVSVGLRQSIIRRDIDEAKLYDESGTGRRKSAGYLKMSVVKDEASVAEGIKDAGKEETSTAVYDTAIGASEASASQATKPASLEEVAPSEAEVKDTPGFRTVAQQTEQPIEEEDNKLPEMPCESFREVESQALSLVADGRDIEKDLLNMTLSTTNVFPESAVVCIISLLAFIWILIIFVTSTVIHTDNATAITSPETGPTATLPYDRNMSLPPYFCHTVRCLREGDYLRSLMDGLERPCDNFYRHVCDRWSRAVGRRHPEAPEAVSTDTEFQSRMQEDLVAFVQNQGTGISVKPASDLLAACQDRVQANSHSIDQAKDLFRKWAIGKWPLGSYDNGRLDDVWSLAGQLLRDLDLAVFVGMTVASDPANTRQGIVAFFEPEPLPILYKDDDRDLITTALQESLLTFGITDAAHVSVLIQEVLSAFNILDGILDIDANTDDAKVSTLFKLDPGFNSLANAALGSPTTLGMSSRVLLLNTGFLEIHLPATLRNISTPPRIFLNYLGFRALVRLAAFLPDRLGSLQQLSLLESTGVRGPPDLLSLCVRAVERAMPLCLLKALAVPLARTGKAVWERRSVFDLETVFLRALHRVRWIDELSLYTLSFRLKHWRFDALYPTDLAWDSSPCALTSSGNMAPIERFVDAFSQRLRELLQQLQTGPDWRTSPPLSVWPQLDLPAQAIRVPQGLLNGSLPSNDTLSTFQLTARVAARLYAAIVPLLYTGTVYDRETALDISSDSQRRLDDLRECLMADWQSVRRRLHVQHTSWRELNAQRWFRDWLLEQAAGLHLAVYAFRELMHVGRIWRVDFRLGNLKYVSSTQLFFLYYALDHCERSSSLYQRRRIRQRRPPAHLRVILPLRHVSVFAREFQCAHRDLLRAESPCRIFDW